MSGMNDVSYILDTDIGPDCDDAAALALAVLYARKHGRRLLAVTHCTSSPWGVGAIRRILKWYGVEDIPIGTLKDEGFLVGPQYERYNRALAEDVAMTEREAEDSVRLCRRLLAQQMDGSVEIIGVGPMRNLAKLLASVGDVSSPLSGRELIRRKVARLTLMAGNFEPGCAAAEWNVEMDVASARYVADEWPGEMVYCGWEVGAQVVALREPCGLPAENPVRMAYQLYSNGAGRSSWDLCTVQWAMEGDSENYTVSAAGQIDVDAHGITRWQPRENGKHRYLKLRASPAQTARTMEDMLAQYDQRGDFA